MSVDDVLAAIDRDRDGAIAALARFVQQPSIAAQGVGLAECAALTRDLLQADGIPAEIYEVPGGPPVVLGRLAAAGPGADPTRTLFCYAHYDVQPVEPVERWTDPPFGGTVRDGRLWGRGASDNKSGVLAFSKAAKAWIEASGRPTGQSPPLRGGRGRDRLAAPRPLVRGQCRTAGRRWDVLPRWRDHRVGGGAGGRAGLKAILYVELRATGAADDVHSLNAAIVPSAGLAARARPGHLARRRRHDPHSRLARRL